jgi:hypothetical protein
MTVTRSPSNPSSRRARVLAASPPSAPRSENAAADEVDWTEWTGSDGERYMYFSLDDEDWPGPSGAARLGIP